MNGEIPMRDELMALADHIGEEMGPNAWSGKLRRIAATAYSLDANLDATINGTTIDLEMIASGRDSVTGEAMTFDQAKLIARRTLNALDGAWKAAALATQQPEAGEVVAYTYIDDVFLAKYWTSNTPPVDWTPLYAAPKAEAQEAARYRWLKERLDCVDFAYGEPQRCVLAFGIPDTLRVSGDLDKTIDAALSAQRAEAKP